MPSQESDAVYEKCSTVTICEGCGNDKKASANIIPPSISVKAIKKVSDEKRIRLQKY